MSLVNLMLDKPVIDIEVLRKQVPMLNIEHDTHSFTYLDYASTTPMPTCVLQAMWDHETHTRSNVHRASYQLAERATQAYWQARQSVARYLNATKAEEIIFTSGTTAAINMLAYGLEHQLKAGDEIIISPAEHHSNLIPWQMLMQRKGIKLKWLPLSTDGRIEVSQLNQLITDRTRLVAITHASNVTGAITDLAVIIEHTKDKDILVFVDGAQMAAHGPIDVQALGVDFYAFSGHKCFGPTGIGALWAREECMTLLQPLMGGGGMVQWVTPEQSEFVTGYQRFEAGTPPIGQAIGFGIALEWLLSLPWTAIQKYERQLTQQTLNMFRNIPGLSLLGPQDSNQRLPLFSFQLDKCHPHDICHLLDQKGLALRGGHHCAQPLLDYFDVGAVCRASLSFLTLPKEINRLNQALIQAIEKLA